MESLDSLDWQQRFHAAWLALMAMERRAEEAERQLMVERILHYTSRKFDTTFDAGSGTIPPSEAKCTDLTFSAIQRS